MYRYGKNGPIKIASNITFFHILMKKPTKISSPVEFQISLVNLKPTHIIVILVTK